MSNHDFRGWVGAGGAEHAALPLKTAQLGLWALLATLTMLFAGFTSAYLVRRAGLDWQAISIPSLLWFNTGVLLLSSLTIEVARGALRRGRTAALKGGLLATTVLGLAFLAGQLFAWQQLAAQGVYLPTSPHSSFFYMLTAVHGLHLVGGLAALLYALSRVWSARWTAAEPTGVNLCATYWHFVDGLWLYLFVLMFAW
ncbi:MAG: heme-copper oxidase subunit III [Acidobacteriota bacterium]